MAGGINQGKGSWSRRSRLCEVGRDARQSLNAIGILLLACTEIFWSCVYCIEKPSLVAGFSGFVRPAWAYSYGCKSRRELVTVSEVKRNCMRATECGEEAWIELAGRWTRIG